ncbi:MAG: lipid A hydroxylase LpxO, partial [Moraxellaceae bacterium]
MIKWIILLIFIGSALYVQRRGRVKQPLKRQILDHSTIMAPINIWMY